MSPVNAVENIKEIIQDFCNLSYSSNPRNRRACSEWFYDWIINSKKYKANFILNNFIELSENIILAIINLNKDSNDPKN
jgi:hypothetical protein